MRVVSISDLAQHATELISYTQRTREPVLVHIQKRPVAYVVDAESFEALQHALTRLRHELFWRGVSEAEAEYRDGEGSDYTDIDALIADLGLRETRRGSRPPFFSQVTSAPSPIQSGRPSTRIRSCAASERGPSIQSISRPGYGRTTSS